MIFHKSRIYETGIYFKNNIIIDNYLFKKEYVKYKVNID